MDQTNTATGNIKLAKEEYITQPVESLLTAWSRFHKTNLFTTIKLGIIGVAAFVVASILVLLVAGGTLNAALADFGGVSGLNTPNRWTDDQAMVVLGSLASLVAIAIVIYMVIIAPVAIAVDFAAIRSQNNQAVTVSTSLKRGMKRLLVALATYILAFLAIVAGLILLIIPGVYIGLRLSYLNSVIANEDNGPIDNLKRSWALTRANLWDIVGVGSVVTILSSIVSIFFGSIMNVLTNTNGSDVLITSLGVLMAAGTMIVGLLSILGVAFRYHQSDLQKQTQLTKTHTDKLNYWAFVLAVIMTGIDGSVNKQTN